MFRRATLLSRSELIRLYWIDGLTIGQIATIHQVKPGDIRARFDRLGILRRVGVGRGKDNELMMLWPALWEYERQRNRLLAKER